MFGKNLKYLREKNGLKQSDLGNMLGRGSSSISQWESGKVLPSAEIIREVSSFFNVSMSKIINTDIEINEKNPIYNERNTRKIPVLGEIAAGNGILAEQNIDFYFEVDDSVKANFALKVNGDSMIDVGINHGDIAFFKKQDIIKNGEIGAIQIQEDNDFEPRATLKRITIQGNSVILSPENKNFDVKVFNLKDIKILGKLVATVHYYE